MAIIHTSPIEKKEGEKKENSRHNGVYLKKRKDKIIGYYAWGYENGKTVYLGFNKEYAEAVALRVTWEAHWDKCKPTPLTTKRHLRHNWGKIDLASIPLGDWEAKHFVKYFIDMVKIYYNADIEIHGIKQIKKLSTCLKDYDCFPYNHIFKDYIDWCFDFKFPASGLTPSIGLLCHENFINAWLIHLSQIESPEEGFAAPDPPPIRLKRDSESKARVQKNDLESQITKEALKRVSAYKKMRSNG